jgi:hypothetical protein
MENETRFDLVQAVALWRQGLTSTTTGILPHEARELETHLFDSIDALKRLGLPEEEAFWLARRRLGPAAQLAQEFQKGEPSRFWRQKLCWLAGGVIGAYAWNTGFSFLSNILNQNWPVLRLQGSMVGPVIQLTGFLLINACLFRFIIKLARGQVPNLLPLTRTVFGTRLRLAFGLGGMLALGLSLAFADSRLVSKSGSGDAFGAMLHAGAAIQLAASAVLNGALVFFMALLVAGLNWRCAPASSGSSQ